MSIGMVIKGPEGLVLAADSRQTITARAQDNTPIPVNFDNARKVIKIPLPNNLPVGLVTYGLGGLGLRSISSLVLEFTSSGLSGVGSVREFAEKLGSHFKGLWEKAMPPGYSGPGISFIVAGMDPQDIFGKVFVVELPEPATPEERSGGAGEFGITWGGQREVVDRLLRGYDVRVLRMVQEHLSIGPDKMAEVEAKLAMLTMQIPFQMLPLQDCIDLAIFFVRTTIAAQTLTIGLRGCGGPIDIAVITPEKEFRWVQEKALRGERGYALRYGQEE
jgi:hypothetical protein